MLQLSCPRQPEGLRRPSALIWENTRQVSRLLAAALHSWHNTWMPDTCCTFLGKAPAMACSSSSERHPHCMSKTLKMQWTASLMSPPLFVWSIYRPAGVNLQMQPGFPSPSQHPWRPTHT